MLADIKLGMMLNVGSLQAARLTDIKLVRQFWSDIISLIILVWPDQS